MKKSILIFSLLFSVVILHSQQQYTDSLGKIINNSKLTFEQVQPAYEELINYFLNENPDTAEVIAKNYWKFSKRIANEKGLAEAEFFLGKAAEIKGEYIKAEKHFQNAVELYSKLENISGHADSEKHIGFLYESQSEYDKALSHYLSAMKLFEKAKDDQGIASCNNGIGHIYFLQDKVEESLKYFNKAQEQLQKIDNPYAKAIVLNNIGMAYDKKNDFSKAMDNYQKALTIQQEIDNPYGVALCLTNIGNLYSKDGAYTQAKKYYDDVLKLNEQLGDQEGIARTYANIGIMYQDQGNFGMAMDYVNKSLNLYESLGNKFGMKEAYATLSGIYEASSDFKSALNYYKYFTEYKDSILGEKSNKQIAELLELYNAEQREKENELLKKNNQLKDSELEKADEKSRRQATQLIALSAGFLLILVLAIVVLRSYHQKKRANVKLSQQNDEIKHQKEVIEEKNRDIMDSIKYAKRIQEAILPPDKVVKSNLENSFIFFKPKDIVSGDFYWMETRDNIILFAAVDCTGHGVPGAFMSIVGHSGLSQAVNEYGITEPGKILDKLNERVRETLRQTDKTEVKDGMDIALVGLDLEHMKGMFAAANNPMYLIRRKGANLITDKKEFEADKEGVDHVLFEIKATKQPIGATEDTKNFVNHVFDLQKGDRIYVFSDGYCDQFGGSENKKFKYATFKKLLLEKIDMPIHDQKAFLNDTIVDWMKDTEQIDDICVIGVEV